MLSSVLAPCKVHRKCYIYISYNSLNYRRVRFVIVALEENVFLFCMVEET